MIYEMNDRQKKVRFELDAGDWHGHGSETLWATPKIGEEIFEIRNSPFFAKGISNGDLVQVSPEGNGLVFDFVVTVERGGHSTYMLLMEPSELRRSAYWSMLQGLGCSFESMQIDLSIGKRLLYSVDVPPSARLNEVYEVLEKGERDGVWIFQEGYAYLVGPAAEN